MSTLNEEVARLKQAKTNIAAAITGKGVEIPAGALLDTYGDYIHQIEVGSTVEGVTSASVTAKRSDVAKGVTTVTSDSHDAVIEGTLELTGTATSEKVLIGESFYNNNLYEKSTGTMPNNGSVTAILNAGECYKVPLGYHDGEGLIQAADLQSQTQGTATVEKILIGETATVNGEPLVGTMPNNGAVAPSALGAGGSYTIPEGYHNGGGIVNVKTLAELTADGDATAAQILTGKKAYVDGTLVTGTMASKGAQTKTFTPSTAKQTYTIPAGYHNGSGIVTCNAVPSTYIPISSANFFKNGTFGALYNLGMVAKVPNGGFIGNEGKTIVFDWNGTWNSDRSYVLPSISTDNIINGKLSIPMKYSLTVGDSVSAIAIRKTVDLTNIKTIKIMASTGGSNTSTRFWALNPTTKKGVCIHGSAFGYSGDGGAPETVLLDVSSLTGHCLIGWYRYGGNTSKTSALRITELSLVQ